MSYDPQTPFPAGTLFTYTATLGSGFFSSPANVVTAAGAYLSQEGIQLLSSSIDTGSFLSALESNAAGSAQFSVTMQCADNNPNDVLLDAQNYCDLAFESASGSPVQSSNITSYTPPAGSAISTGLAAAPSPGGPGFSLSGGQSALVAIVVIVVVLIIAVILLPENAGRAVRSIAG